MTTTTAPARPLHRWKSNETTDSIPYAYDYCLACQVKRPSERGGAACTAATDREPNQCAGCREHVLDEYACPNAKDTCAYCCGACCADADDPAGTVLTLSVDAPTVVPAGERDPFRDGLPAGTHRVYFTAPGSAPVGLACDNPGDLLDALDAAREALLLALPFLAPRKPHAPAVTEDGIVLPTHALEQWTGRTLDEEDRVHLADAIDRSSIPDAVGLIVDAWGARS